MKGLLQLLVLNNNKEAFETEEYNETMNWENSGYEGITQRREEKWLMWTWGGERRGVLPLLWPIFTQPASELRRHVQVRPDERWLVQDGDRQQNDYEKHVRRLSRVNLHCTVAIDQLNGGSGWGVFPLRSFYMCVKTSAVMSQSVPLQCSCKSCDTFT